MDQPFEYMHSVPVADLTLAISVDRVFVAVVRDANETTTADLMSVDEISEDKIDSVSVFLHGARSLFVSTPLVKSHDFVGTPLAERVERRRAGEIEVHRN